MKNGNFWYSLNRVKKSINALILYFAVVSSDYSPSGPYENPTVIGDSIYSILALNISYWLITKFVQEY